jgi:hypothetical protein
MGNLLGIEYFQMERIIDGEHQIMIGILAKNSPNPYSSQGIRIGSNGKIKRLEKFIELPNNLIFEYESDISLTLSKKDNNIIINVKEPETSTTIIKPMDTILIEMFKKIGWRTISEEYDKIYDFIKPNFEVNQMER